MPDVASRIRIPAGTLAFLFTDIAGSTMRWEAHPEQMQHALRRHNSIVQEAIERYGGYIFKTMGDAFCASFPIALSALKAALDAQRALMVEAWPVEIGPLLVRMAIHVGAAEESDGDYFGQPLNRVARLLSAGHGGQILLSNPAYDLVRDNLPPAVTMQDMGEHRLKDLTRPERIFQVIASSPPWELPSEFPPLKTLDNRPNNLPAQPTPLVGREKEVNAVLKVLGRDDVHLLTLTGPGGTGKTRLALQAAAEATDSFEHGVFFVNLAPISDPTLVVSEIAQTLGVRESGQPLLLALKDYLREKRLLLVLDNFEQVVDAAPLVADLIQSAPGLKALVTSRATLHLRGEKEYPVPALQLPVMDAKRPLPLEKLAQYEAVRLFIARAVDARPDFEVTNETAPSVAEICVRLDGLPLAIELAAARVKALTPQAILSRLQSRLKVLTGGARDLPARQQTLRNTIEWSYDLLNKEEKKLFGRMSVFVGGRTLEALEAVCDFDGELGIDVLDGVSSLIDKSLLRQEAGVGGESRYVMLETIHEFAGEKLEESGEAEEILGQHAIYFTGIAAQAQPHLQNHLQVEWMDRIEEEHDNFRAALGWAIDRQRADLALAICGDVGEFWIRRGYHTEGREWITASLALNAEMESATPEFAAIMKAHRAEALLHSARLAGRQGDEKSSKLLSEESIALYTEVADKSGMAQALINLSLSDRESSYASMQPQLEEALNLAREANDDFATAYALYQLGDLALLRNELSLAYSHYTECLELAREGGRKPLIALTLTRLGNMARARGDYAVAGAMYEESLALYREIGDRWASIYALGNMGQLACVQGDVERARALLNECLDLAKEFRYLSWISQCLTSLAALHISLGEHVSARPLLEESITIEKTIGAGSFQSCPLNLLGWVMSREEAHGGAATIFRESMKVAISDTQQNATGPQAHELAVALAGLADIQVKHGDVARATGLLGASQALYESLGPTSHMEGTIEHAIYRKEYERILSMTHKGLDAEKWQKAWEEGRAMSTEQAVQYALEEV